MFDNNRAIYVAWLLLLVFTGWVIYSTIHLVIQLRADSPAEPFIIPSKPRENLINTIETIHIFGSPEINLATTGPTMGMELKGIFLTIPSKNSRVLIALTGQTLKSYAEGDALSNGARVYQILTDSVILTKNSTLVKLVLPIQGIAFSNMLPSTTLFAVKKSS